MEETGEVDRPILFATMVSLTTPSEMPSATQAVIPGAKVKFERPAGVELAVGYEPQFKLQDTLKDLAHRMRRYLAEGSGESAHWG
jgi:hypothetical protein